MLVDYARREQDRVMKEEGRRKSRRWNVLMAGIGMRGSKSLGLHKVVGCGPLERQRFHMRL